MSLNNGAETDVLLGSVMSVDITWSVVGLSSITFYLNQCTVTHGKTTFPIILDGCYSDAVGVTADSDASATSASFTFLAFKGFEETEAEQTIDCSVKLCEEGSCAFPTNDSQCPSTGNDAFFKYTVNGA